MYNTLISNVFSMADALRNYNNYYATCRIQGYIPSYTPLIPYQSPRELLKVLILIFYYNKGLPVMLIVASSLSHSLLPFP